MYANRYNWRLGIAFRWVGWNIGGVRVHDTWRVGGCVGPAVLTLSLRLENNARDPNESECKTVHNTHTDTVHAMCAYGGQRKNATDNVAG